MANFTALKTAINNAIKTNGNEEITGAILQAILDAMVETLGDSAITDLENAITTEVTNRENAVGGVADDMAAEALARANKDNQLDNRINQEEYNRQNADAALSQTMSQGFQTLGSQLTTLINTEVTNRENAVSDVADDLAAEALARANKDNQLDNSINAEVSNRQNADAALSQTMNQGFQTLGSQISALNAAISALNAAYQNGFLYGGIATPSSSPSNNKCFYIALQGGTYTNFGGVGVVEGINIIKNDSGWKVEHIYDQTTLLNEFYLLRQQVIQAITSFAPIAIEGDVTNAPDEEDLTSNANHLLQFKNNAYSPLEFSGLGRKYLRKNIAPLSESAPFNGFVEGVTAEETLSGTPTQIFWDRMNTRFVGIKDGIYYAAWTDDDNYVPVSTSLVYMYNGTPYQWTGSDFIVDETEVPNLVNCLTQDMINEPNTIYIIRYDYTLKEDITIPANCVLEFDGGSLDNGTITFNMTKIVSDGKCFGSNIAFTSAHYISNEEVLISWFVDKKDAMNNATGIGTFHDCHDEIRNASLLAGLIQSSNASGTGGVLNLEGIQLAVVGTIVFDSPRDNNLIKNANIWFFSTADCQSVFHYNYQYITYAPIENCVFKYMGSSGTMNLQKPQKTYHEHINVIRWEKASLTTFSYWRDIQVSDFTGYIFVNQTYLQQCSFLNITSSGSNGFISYNVDGIYAGTKGSSNILSFDNCNLNNSGSSTANTSKCTEVYIWDLINFMDIVMRNIVCQGQGIAGQRMMRLAKSTNSFANQLVLDEFWCEYSTLTVDPRIFIGCSVDLYLKGANVQGFVTLGNHETVNIFDDRKSFDFYVDAQSFVTCSEIHADTTQVLIYYNPSTYKADCEFSDKFKQWLDKGIIREINTRRVPYQVSQKMPSASVKTPEYINMKDNYFYSLYYAYLYGNPGTKLNLYVSSYNNIPTAVMEGLVTNTPITYQLLPFKMSDLSGCYYEIIYRCAPTIDVTEENKNTISATIFGKPLVNFEVGTQAGVFSAWKKMSGIRDLWYNVGSLSNAKVEIAYYMLYNSCAIRKLDGIYYNYSTEDIEYRQFGANFMPIIQINGNNIPHSFLCENVRIDNVIIKTSNKQYIKYGGKLKPLQTLSGNTSSRPTHIEVGTNYFDTSLNKPIFAKAVANDGTVTWVDATGATV